MSNGSRLLPLMLALFVPSGVAGLIYQSVWSHYLGLTLGHAAYAQTLVLAIFMGGMAVGAYGASRYAWPPRTLVIGYAAVEAVIGLAGLAFHPLFEAYTGFSTDHALPMLSRYGMTWGYQWITAAAMILPQCVLLGATFPLLSAGLMQSGKESDGRVLGGLYFCNSIGAAAGALLATFVLLPAIGLPGAMTVAGLLNLGVGALAWAASRRFRATGNAQVVAVASGPAAEARGAGSGMGTAMLGVSALTGATSFAYEIGWVRLLNQVLGTTIHAFELMLSAFIFGLACGGLWVRRHTTPTMDAVRVVGFAQVWMGVSALLSVVVFTQSFLWVSWIQAALSRSEEGYFAFSAASAVICLLVMFPAAFFAGMTLPLITVALLRRGGGSRVIGRVYAANTLGAIVGIVLMVHVLTPLMGIRGALIFAALTDAAIGLWLLGIARVPGPTRVVAAFATFAALVVVATVGRIDPRQQVSGVFRTGLARVVDDAEVVYLRDGKTATVAVTRFAEGDMALSTNGKTDAALSGSLDALPSPDEPTMLMLGVLPLIHHPSPGRVAIVGWGSGLTTHTLAGSPLPQSIDTIEIERAILDAGREFGARVDRAYSDPRSAIIVEDARTHFASSGKSYDVVVSEPSNPWVSGVANLFTHQFYRRIHRHLSDDGVLVQWVHVYELSEPLLATMLAALLEVFPETSMYVTNTSDVVLVAHKGRVHPPRFSALVTAPLDAELTRVGLGTEAEFALRRIGGPEVLQTHVRQHGAVPYSDYHPVVALGAPRARFRNERADGLFALVDNGLPVLDMLEGRRPVAAGTVVVNRQSRLSESHRRAVALRDALLVRDPAFPGLAGSIGYSTYLGALLSLSSAPVRPEQVSYWSDALANVADGIVGLLPPEDQQALWRSPSWMADPAMQPAAVSMLLDVYARSAERDGPGMGAASRRLMTSPEFLQLGNAAREHVLIVAQLAALHAKDPAASAALADAHREDVPYSSRMRPVRDFLDAWARRQAGGA